MIDKNNIENYVCDSCGNNEDCTIIECYMGEVVACEKCRSPKDDKPESTFKRLKNFNRIVSELHEVAKSNAKLYTNNN